MRWNSEALKKRPVLNVVVFRGMCYVKTRAGWLVLFTTHHDRETIKKVRLILGSPITSINEKEPQKWMWYEPSKKERFEKLFGRTLAIDTVYAGPNIRSVR